MSDVAIATRAYFKTYARILNTMYVITPQLFFNYYFQKITYRTIEYVIGIRKKSPIHLNIKNISLPLIQNTALQFQKVRSSETFLTDIWAFDLRDYTPNAFYAIWVEIIINPDM